MLKLSKIVKNYKETGALSENVSVYGFLDEHVFLTKAGDLGVVLNVEGVDYECLNHKQTDGLALAPAEFIIRIVFTFPHGLAPHPENEQPQCCQAPGAMLKAKLFKITYLACI